MYACLYIYTYAFIYLQMFATSKKENASTGLSDFTQRNRGKSINPTPGHSWLGCGWAVHPETTGQPGRNSQNKIIMNTNTLNHFDIYDVMCIYINICVCWNHQWCFCPKKSLLLSTSQFTGPFQFQISSKSPQKNPVQLSHISNLIKGPKCRGYTEGRLQAVCAADSTWGIFELGFRDEAWTW